MSKATMPEPDVFDGTRLDGSIASHSFSRTATEAYAAARVREALEEAAKAVNRHDKRGKEWVRGSLWDDINREAVARIRALIPSTPA